MDSTFDIRYDAPGAPGWRWPRVTVAGHPLTLRVPVLKMNRRTPEERAGEVVTLAVGIIAFAVALATAAVWVWLKQTL
jgi:hypothetical protein